MTLSQNELIELTSIVGSYLAEHRVNCPDEPKAFKLVEESLLSIIEKLEENYGR